MINDEDMIKDFYNRKRKTTKQRDFGQQKYAATCVHLLISFFFIFFRSVVIRSSCDVLKKKKRQCTIVRGMLVAPGPKLEGTKVERYLTGSNNSSVTKWIAPCP